MFSVRPAIVVKGSAVGAVPSLCSHAAAGGAGQWGFGVGGSRSHCGGGIHTLPSWSGGLSWGGAYFALRCSRLFKLAWTHATSHDVRSAREAAAQAQASRSAGKVAMRAAARACMNGCGAGVFRRGAGGPRGAATERARVNLQYRRQRRPPPPHCRRPRVSRRSLVLNPTQPPANDPPTLAPVTPHRCGRLLRAFAACTLAALACAAQAGRICRLLFALNPGAGGLLVDLHRLLWVIQ